MCCFVCVFIECCCFIIVIIIIMIIVSPSDGAACCCYYHNYCYYMFVLMSDGAIVFACFFISVSSYTLFITFKSYVQYIVSHVRICRSYLSLIPLCFSLTNACDCVCRIAFLYIHIHRSWMVGNYCYIDIDEWNDEWCMIWFSAYCL